MNQEFTLLDKDKTSKLRFGLYDFNDPFQLKYFYDYMIIFISTHLEVFSES